MGKPKIKKESKHINRVIYFTTNDDYGGDRE
jgi:hypothetical protein